MLIPMRHSFHCASCSGVVVSRFMVRREKGSFLKARRPTSTVAAASLGAHERIEVDIFVLCAAKFCNVFPKA